MRERGEVNVIIPDTCVKRWKGERAIIATCLINQTNWWYNRFNTESSFHDDTLLPCACSRAAGLVYVIDPKTVFRCELVVVDRVIIFDV